MLVPGSGANDKLGMMIPPTISNCSTNLTEYLISMSPLLVAKRNVFSELDNIYHAICKIVLCGSLLNYPAQFNHVQVMIYCPI